MLESRLRKGLNVDEHAGKSRELTKGRVDQALETRPAEPDRQYGGATRLPG